MASTHYSFVSLLLVSVCLTASAQVRTAMSSSPVSYDQGSAQQGSAALPSVSDERAHDARISPGDVIEVRIFGLPEMTREERVSNTGVIVLPFIGTVMASGRTTSELEKNIASALRTGGFVNDPQVSVSAKELHGSVVSVSGEIGKPGLYPVYGNCSLEDIIMMAGGLTPQSGHIVNITRRNEPDKPIRVDLTSVSSAQTPSVYPGDSIVITKAGIVYVLGDVGHPAGVVMQDDREMTVLQALAFAGGANKGAKIKMTHIIRKGPQGVEEVRVPLKQILEARKADVALRPGDVLYVPGGSSGAFLHNPASILQAAALAAIFRP